jgi:ubiquinone/menaquinone biosynthesis C-methylase UbiE
MRGGFFKGIIISYALHEKIPQVRQKMAKEAQRLLTPGGKLILVDYESPWNGRSRLGAFFTHLIERVAGGDHFRNYRHFLREGGLREWTRRQHIIERERYEVELASSSILIGQWKND